MENTKLEICKKCQGAGRINGGNENSTWSKTCEDCHGAGFFRVPMTNADRIRAMSDEELADNWMRDFVICHRCAYQYECECYEHITYEKCKEGIVKWLKQPWKENEDEQSGTQKTT